MKVTIKDVAEAAGVSAMTVSTVLHGSGSNVRFSEETAERIRALAKELHYQPNYVARSLRLKRTNTVGVVFQHFDRLSEDNPYYPKLLNGVMSALFPESYTLALCPSLVQGDNPHSIWDGRFDGVLWARPDFSEASLEKFRNSTVPLVMMHAPVGTADGISSFTADNVGALEQVIRHLSGLGHEKVTFAVDPVNEHTAEGIARVDAFLNAASEAKIESRVWFWDERTRTLDEFLSRNRDCTAIACFSDTIAGHLLTGCKELGIQIPRDLSVIGFDSTTFCERTTPRLTSVHQSVEQMAYDATKHLLDLIKARREGEILSLPISSTYACSLDVRDSTAPPSKKKITK